MASSSEDNTTGQPEDDVSIPTAPTRTEPDEDNDNDNEEIQEDDDEEEEEEEEDDDEQPPLTRQARMQSDRAKMETLFSRLSAERVPVRVHDVLIKGNAKTKDSLVEAEVEALKTATTVQELLQAASIANARLQRLEIFDSVTITLDSGPPELPGTANVVVEVVEAKNPLSGDLGIFAKPEVVWVLGFNILRT